MNVIETKNLERRFGKTNAVHDLTLAVPEGSIFALLGHNGAGKTTTIKVLMNLLLPSAGSAHVLGVDSRKLGVAERREIGYVSENQQLPLWMTVRQFLNYCRPWYPKWDGDLEKKLLARFELPQDRKLKHLSRGMLMKTALLSSLAYRPKLLVLDEPFSGLDPLVREEFIQGVLEVSEIGDWTVFISSHDIHEVEMLCDRVGILSNGRLQLAEEVETLQARFRRIEVALHEPAVDSVAVPKSWLCFEQAGSVVRFIEQEYAREKTETLCREKFPSATVTAHPMSLREIFVALMRAERPQEKKGALV
ncbi:MAG: ABC transporter ATP-binding protein [Nibricoccus sp.]